jgi:hypothetical protein
MAQTQEFSIRRVTSGAASPTTTIGNTGNNANLAPTVQQVANTGNVLNEQGVVQNGTGNTPFVDNSCFVDSFGFLVCPTDGFFFGPNDGSFFDGGDITFEGSAIDISPSVTGGATQTIEQAAGS